MWYWVKTNPIVKLLWYNQIWSVSNSGKKIYITFDDGPTPQITEWVLETLELFNAKATFFCIGNNIAQNPQIFQKIIARGHAIGNHTYHHVNGWKTNTQSYLEEVQLCAEKLEEQQKDSKLFRPPYGKITPTQSKKLRKEGYKIIMWDVLTADFDTAITPEQCFNNAIQKVENGSIIVFHDSHKAFQNLHYALPKALEYYKNKGFQLETL